MPRGRKDISKDAKKFTKDYQPTPEAKSAGHKRLGRIKEALEFLGAQLHSEETNLEGETILLSWEAKIGHELMRKAIKGDLGAVKILADICGWNAPINQNINLKADLAKLVEEGDLVIDNSQGEPAAMLPRANE